MTRAKKKRAARAESKPSAGRRETKRAVLPAASQQPLAKVAPGVPGGPNRAERKEEARRQREALRRGMARRRYYRIAGVALTVLSVAGAITAYSVTRPSPAAAAGCGSVRTIPPYAGKQGDRAHVLPQARLKLSTYRSQPPVSGPHDSRPLDAGVYEAPPDPYRTLHSLEHGAVIIWYREGLGNSSLQKIKDFYRTQSHGDHVIVAPYSYPDQGSAGDLPAGKQVVLVAWHRLRSCRQASLDVVRGFVAVYRAPTGTGRPIGYKGEAPEPGVPI